MGLNELLPREGGSDQYTKHFYSLLGFTARKHAQWRDNFAIDDEESICICGTSDYCFNLLKISNLIGWNPSWPGAQGISQQMKFRGSRQSFSCQFLRVRAVIDFINVCKIADDIVAACDPAIKNDSSAIL